MDAQPASSMQSDSPRVDNLRGTIASDSGVGLQPFSPPYDSPIEHDFAWGLTKYLRPEVTLDTQVEVDTICGRFRIDFVASGRNRKVAFECDGKEFHNFDRDEWRDAMILGAKAVDVIYRIPGKDVKYRLDDCLLLLSEWENHLFTERRRHCLINLASDAVRSQYSMSEGDIGREMDSSCATVQYDCPEAEYPSPHFSELTIRRRSYVQNPGRRQFWQAIFAYAQKYGGGNLDALRDQHLREATSRRTKRVITDFACEGI